MKLYSDSIFWHVALQVLIFETVMKNLDTLWIKMPSRNWHLSGGPNFNILHNFVLLTCVFVEIFNYFKQSLIPDPEINSVELWKQKWRVMVILIASDLEHPLTTLFAYLCMNLYMSQFDVCFLEVIIATMWQIWCAVIFKRTWCCVIYSFTFLLAL